MSHFIEDEYTQNKVTNDQQIVNSEFGATQSNEFSDTGDMHLHRSAYNANLNQTVKNTAQAEAGSSASMAASEGASSVATTVGGGGVAHALAAGTVSSVVVASSITITALSVVTGLSVALHNYEFKLNSFIVTSNQLTYSLTITDTEMSEEDYEHWFEENDKAGNISNSPFIIRIYNNNYDSSQELFYFEQSGVFSNLTLGDKYNLVVSENRYGGQIIYEDEFVTYANSAFLGFDFYGESDYENGTFDVTMDFIDEKDAFSDFKLDFFQLGNHEKVYASFPLDKVSGTQNVSFLDENSRPRLELGEEYEYAFSYSDSGSVKEYKSGVVTLYDRYGRSAEFYSFTFDRTANFLDQTIEVKLDYVDYLNWYDNFALILTPHYTEVEQGDDCVIELASTTEIQTISMSEYELDLEYPTYTYVLTADYRGNNIILEEEVTPFQFTDNSGAVSKFNSFIFDKTANFLDYTIEVQLDYVDDFNYFDNFLLTLTAHYGGDATSGDGKEDSREIHLAKTLEPQTINMMELDLNIEYPTYTYVLTADRRGVNTVLAEEVTPFQFTDNSGAVSEFNGFTFDQTMNWQDYTMEFTLDYVDDFGYYDNFVVHMTEMYNDVEANRTRDFDISLEKTTQKQTINVSEFEPTVYEINPRFSYKYYVTCDYRGLNETIVEETPFFELHDSSGYKSEFNAFIFDKKANFLTSTFEVQLDYVDDYDLYNNFKLTLTPNDGVNAQFVFNLEKTTSKQTCTIDYEYAHYGFDFDQHFTYILEAERDYEPVTLSSSDEEFQFTDNSGAISAFAGLEFDGTYSYKTGLATLRLDYQDDFGYYSDFIFTIYNYDDPDDYREFNLLSTTDEQTINIGDADINVDETWWTYKLTVQHRKEGLITLAESAEYEEFRWEDPTMVTDPNSVSVTFINNEANYNDRSIWVQLDYRDDYDRYSNFVLTLFGKSTNDADDFSHTLDFELEKTKEPQQIIVDGIDEDADEYGAYYIDFVKYKLGYNLYWWETTTEDGYDHYLFGDESSYQEINLTNSAVSELNGVDSNFQIFKEGAATADQYYAMWLYLDLVDENNAYSGLHGYWSAKGQLGYSEEASVEPMGDMLRSGWQKVIVYPDGSSNIENGESICDGTEWEFIIQGFYDDPYDDKDEEFIENICSVTCTPTFVDEPDPQVLGIDFSDSMMPIMIDDETSYTLTAFATITTENYDRFADVQIIFKSEVDGTTYTYNIDESIFSNYFDFPVINPEEGSISVFDLEGVPFTISVRYSTLTDNPLDPDSPIKSEPIEVICCTHRSFTVSV